MTPLAARPAVSPLRVSPSASPRPATRRLVLTPAPVKDDPRIRRYRLAKVRIESPGAATKPVAAQAPLALGS